MLSRYTTVVIIHFRAEVHKIVIIPHPVTKKGRPQMGATLAVNSLHFKNVSALQPTEHLLEFLVSVHSSIAQFLFDAEQLVVFSHTV